MNKQQILKEFKETFESALTDMADSGKKELLRQGHKATGSLIKSVEPKVASTQLTKMVGVILANDYGLIVDGGVKASRVPFSGVGGGGTSQYIQALIEWANIVRPSLTDEETKSFVFAVANTHRREGIPTNGSFSYSENGRRTEWIRYGLEEFVPILEGNLRLFDLLSRLIECEIDDALNTN